MRLGPWRLSVAGVVLIAGALAAAEIPAGQRRSGFDFMAPETQAIQADDTSNPGMLWVQDGERLFNQPAGRANVACSNCHDAAALRGIAARYPAFDEKTRRPIDLADRINACRQDHQAAEPLPREGDGLNALTTYIAHQSRGMPVAPSEDPRLAPFRENGRRLFETRLGQLDLSCASCHDDNWGKRLGGSAIPQGHPNAYPLYRLEWQSVGSLQRRLRNCMVGVRADPFGAGAPELVDLELYLMSRAKGLPIETPGVRP